MTVQDVFAWYSVIFYAPILIGMVLIFASLAGFGGDTDIDADADLEADHDIESDSWTLKALSLFGVGRCPISIILFTGLLIFGGTGIILNYIFAPTFAILSVIGALLITLVSVRFVAITVSKIMPSTETYALEAEDLVGMVGVVVIKVNNTFGQVHVRDTNGGLHRLDAKTYDSETVFESGTSVLVSEYKDGCYYVVNETAIW